MRLLKMRKLSTTTYEGKKMRTDPDRPIIQISDNCTAQLLMMPHQIRDLRRKRRFGVN
jgi:hypothetical protein